MSYIGSIVVKNIVWHLVPVYYNESRYKYIEPSIARRTTNLAAAHKLSQTFEKGCVLKTKGEYIEGYKHF